MTLSEQRAKLVHDWRAILDKAEAETRALSADEKTQVEKIEADIDALKATIDARAKLDAEERGFVPDSQRAKETATPQIEDKPDYRTSFWNAMRSGIITPDVRETRDLKVGTDSLGGFTVPDEFKKELIAALIEQNVMRGLARVFPSVSGTMSIPVNSAHGSASWKAEEAAYATSDETFAEVTLNAYKATSLIKVSEELLHDSAFPLESFLATEFGRRIGKLEEEAFVVGDGSAKPTGVVGSSTLGTTATATNAIVVDEIMDLHYAIGRAYRQRSSWLMADSTVKALRKLKTGVSGDNTYLWQAGLRVGEPDTLLGRPVYVSEFMPTIATGNKAVLFGDFSYYYIADRDQMSMQRLTELYSGNGQIGFRQFKRVDGKLSLATSIYHLKLA
jgi:HK97 family phage major capsid protein